MVIISMGLGSLSSIPHKRAGQGPCAVRFHDIINIQGQISEI